jgi:hypothetical protein
MAAPVGIELAKQPVPVDHLADPAQARLGALLLDQKGRVDRARRIVQRHHQVVLRLIARQPGKPRGILMQHHADERPARPLLAMRRTLRRRLRQPGPVQREPRHRVAELVVVALHQLLVKMFRRKPVVALHVKPQHALDLLDRRPPARRLADPPVAQSHRSLIAQPVAPPPKRPLRHPQHLGCFLLR